MFGYWDIFSQVSMALFLPVVFFMSLFWICCSYLVLSVPQVLIPLHLILSSSTLWTSVALHLPCNKDGLINLNSYVSQHSIIAGELNLRGRNTHATKWRPTEKSRTASHCALILTAHTQIPQKYIVSLRWACWERGEQWEISWSGRSQYTGSDYVTQCMFV